MLVLERALFSVRKLASEPHERRHLSNLFFFVL